jgi:hypothetical protein
LRKVWRQPSTDALRRGSIVASWTESRRHSWWHLPVASHQKGRLAGACGYWPTSYKLVELEIVDEEVSYQTVRRTLKKTNSSRT